MKSFDDLSAPTRKEVRSLTLWKGKANILSLRDYYYLPESLVLFAANRQDKNKRSEICDAWNSLIKIDLRSLKDGADIKKALSARNTCIEMIEIAMRLS